ncbi:MAG: glutaminase [Alphaproteobacteria bacterium]|nr:glutaminase [Alphaproteobacteria bacterium]MBV9371567.1 glutaminase [Alphaproteobacteria bacterium]MBV9902691.1 glutaminase [Alphaproteobacteria bacterium]
MDYQAILDQVVADVSAYRGQGTVASYIPSLARADPHKFGIAVALEDGAAFVAGDADETFSIQSLSYVFTLNLALQQLKSALWNHVGREPSGAPVSSIVQLEIERGRPRNPMTSPGAIVVCDQLIGRRPAAEAADELIGFLRERAGDQGIGIDEGLAMSESQAGAFNRSLAHFIAAFGNLRNPVEDVLGLYYRHCSIAMSCRQLARAALYLAFDGTDPVSGDAVTTQSRSRRINALMLTCGHYDNSGDFAFRVGLPGKSSVAGAILAVAPGRGSVCVWSPGLNAAGTSLVGAIALERLVEATGWSVF